MNSDKTPIVSVVIATYNRCVMLDGLVDALTKQTLPAASFEIIIVDDCSTDETQDKLRQLQAQSAVTLRVVRLATNSGPACARNKGIRLATGSIVAITDDDCLPTPRWLEQLLHAFNSEAVVGAEGPIITDLEQVSACTHQIINNTPGAFFTANVTYRRDILFKAGLFDEQFSAPHDEDVDLGLRVLRYGQILFKHNAIVFHPPIPIDLVAHAKKIRYCRSNIRFFLKHPSRIGKHYRCLWAYVLRDAVVGICKNQIRLTPLVSKDLRNYLGYLLLNLLRLFYVVMLIPELKKEEIVQRRLLERFLADDVGDPTVLTWTSSIDEPR